MIPIKIQSKAKNSKGTETAKNRTASLNFIFFMVIYILEYVTCHLLLWRVCQSLVEGKRFTIELYSQGYS